MKVKSFKDIRNSLRLTQTEMCLKAKVSISTIQKFEAGVYHPGFRIAERLAKAYGVSVRDVESFALTEQSAA